MEETTAEPTAETGAGLALPRAMIKRDGRRAPFQLSKIASAIERAGAATGEFGKVEADRLADAVGLALGFTNLFFKDIHIVQERFCQPLL